MLQLGLKHCFDWLKREYWDKQNETLSDFVIEPSNESTEQDGDNHKLVVDLYCEIALTNFLNSHIVAFDDLEKINTNTYRKFIKSGFQPKGFNGKRSIADALYFLFQKTRNNLVKHRSTEIAEYIANILTTSSECFIGKFVWVLNKLFIP